ncbi:MAG TPA: dihydrodipicolinate reductase C-terminal domain-containing protein, partial [Candidatus Eisenbacteria bacterium]
ARPDDFRVVDRIDSRDAGGCRARLDAHPDAVVVDFSLAAAVPALLEIMDGRSNPLVSGTTGLGDTERRGLSNRASKAAVVWAPNMGLGIPLLARLVREAMALVPDAQVAIVETHHRHKKDRPSGTALYLAEAAGGSVDMHSLRIGEVVGEHRLELAFGEERLTFTHQALSRDVFADGALAAARFAAGATAGLYDMEAVLAGLAGRSSR